MISALRRRYFAKLRLKTLLIVAATLASLLLILYIPLRVFLFSRFIALEERIAVYAPIDDLDGKAQLVLRLISPRIVYLQGRLGVYYFIVSQLIAGLVFGALILLLLDRIILSRLSRLSRSVRRIGTSGNLAARVAAVGHDELSDLAGEVNNMLAALQSHNSRKPHGNKPSMAHIMPFACTVAPI